MKSKAGKITEANKKQAEKDFRRNWLKKPSKKSSDIPAHLQEVEILCVQCGYIWFKMTEDQIKCPRCIGGKNN